MARHVQATNSGDWPLFQWQNPLAPDGPLLGTRTSSGIDAHEHLTHVAGSFRIRRSSTIAAILGGLLAAAALVVAAGWLLQWRGLLQWTDGYVMVFNTALCFALSGLALACSSTATPLRRRVQSTCGLAVAAMGAAALAQHLSGLDFGIDWPALHRAFDDFDPFPGRMAAATSVAFIAAGSALLLGPRIASRRNALVLQLINAVVAVVGALALAGQVLQLGDVFEGYWRAPRKPSTTSGTSRSTIPLRPIVI